MPLGVGFVQELAEERFGRQQILVAADLTNSKSWSMDEDNSATDCDIETEASVSPAQGLAPSLSPSVEALAGIAVSPGVAWAVSSRGVPSSRGVAPSPSVAALVFSSQGCQDDEGPAMGMTGAHRASSCGSNEKFKLYILLLTCCAVLILLRSAIYATAELCWSDAMLC